MKRRDFVAGLLAIGVSAVVADKLAFAEGLGRTFASAPRQLKYQSTKAIQELQRRFNDYYYGLTSDCTTTFVVPKPSESGSRIISLFS